MTGADRITSLVAACAACVLPTLSGCASAPSPEHEEVVADALAFETPGAWSSAAEQGRTPDGWLRSFNDPELESFVGEALKNNLDLRGANARLQRAGAAAEAAGAALTPTVNAALGATEQGGAGADRIAGRGAGLSMSWEVDVWGRVSSEAAAATERYEGAALDFEFARQSIAAATAKAYFLAIESLQQQRLSEEEVGACEEIARVTGLRREAGKATEQDVRLASAELSAAKDRLAGATDAHDQSVRALEALLGRYPGNDLTAPDALPPMPAGVPAGVPSEVLERRPDVAASERRVRGAFQSVRAKQLARLPRLSLTGSVGVSSDLSELTRRPGFFSVGANFLAPIFDGGARQADVEIATAEQEEALADYGQTALRAFTEVENALGSERSLAEREGHLSASVEDNAEALRLRKIEADAGKADMLSVLQLQRQVCAARAGLASLRTARLAQRVDLHLALGGDFEATPEP